MEIDDISKAMATVEERGILQGYLFGTVNISERQKYPGLLGAVKSSESQKQPEEIMRCLEIPLHTLSAEEFNSVMDEVRSQHYFRRLSQLGNETLDVVIEKSGKKRLTRNILAQDLISAINRSTGIGDLSHFNIADSEENMKNLKRQSCSGFMGGFGDMIMERNSLIFLKEQSCYHLSDSGDNILIYILSPTIKEFDAYSLLLAYKDNLNRK